MISLRSFFSVLVILTFLLRSISTPSSLYRISSNATQLFPNITLDPASLFIVNFPSMYRKLSHDNVYRFYCCIGILISSLCPNVVLANGLYMWISSLTMRSSKIRSFLMLRMSLFRCFAPWIPKIKKIKRSMSWASFSSCLMTWYYKTLSMLLVS